MRISAGIALVGAVIFSLVCFGVAIKGFSSLGDVDPTQLSDAQGFVWFWGFLGGVGVLFGALSLWIIRTQKEGADA